MFLIRIFDLNNNVKKTYIENNGLTTLYYKVLSEEKLVDGVKKITVEF